MPSTPTEAKTLNLTALIERLEKADGPDRELDAAICRYLAGSPADYCYGLHGDLITDVLVPAITASMDSAVTLATRILPEMSEIHPRTYTGGKFHHCEIETDDGDFEASNCPNLALAICLATLRALEAKNG